MNKISIFPTFVGNCLVKFKSCKQSENRATETTVTKGKNDEAMVYTKLENMFAQMHK